MIEFLTSTIPHLLPYYILAFVVGELLLIIREKKGLRLEIIVAVIIGLLLTILGQFQEYSSWAPENRPILLAIVNLLGMLMPLAVLVIANQFLLRINKNVTKHGGLLGVVLITMFIWPLWALYITCASGLDCL